jgi:hypothetical protein
MLRLPQPVSGLPEQPPSPECVWKRLSSCSSASRRLLSSLLLRLCAGGGFRRNFGGCALNGLLHFRPARLLSGRNASAAGSADGSPLLGSGGADAKSRECSGRAPATSGTCFVSGEQCPGLLEAGGLFINRCN